MRQRMAAMICLAALLSASTPLFASGPIARAGEQQARAAAEQTPVLQRTRMKSPPLYWGGIVIGGIGSFLLGRGLVMQPVTVSCVSYYGIADTCEQSGGNKTAYISSGLGLAAAGFTMIFIGAERVAVSPMVTANGLGLQGHWRF